MQTKLLAISAAILLMSSSVTALGNSENVLGGLTSSVTKSELLYPELALAQGQVGGLRRRKVTDLDNGPRYGFPATEKKAEFGTIKRSIVGDLFQSKKTTQSGKQNDDEEDDDSSNDKKEAKRSLKEKRRRIVKRDAKGAVVKAQMGTEAILGESQKLVANTQISANKIVGQVGRTAGGMALSLTDHPAQSKAASDSHDDDDKSSNASAATTNEDGKSSSTKDPTTKVDDASKKGDSSEPKSLAPVAPQITENNSSTETAATDPNDSTKMDPGSMASGDDGKYVNSGSNYNANYFEN